MSDQNENDKKMDDLERAAIATSATIVVFFVVYWAFQIQTTYSLLAMAYEW
jgi:hypothetical protein